MIIGKDSLELFPRVPAVPSVGPQVVGGTGHSIGKVKEVYHAVTITIGTVGKISRGYKLAEPKGACR